MKLLITLLSFLLFHLQSNAQEFSSQVRNTDTEVDSKSKNEVLIKSLARETEKMTKINMYTKCFIEFDPKSEECTSITVTQVPEFPGGINGFLSILSNNFDVSAIDEIGILKTDVEFVIEVDGSISNITAKGNNQNFNKEAIRTIRSIKKKWSPAILENTPVSYRFRMPHTQQFE